MKSSPAAFEHVRHDLRAAATVVRQRPGLSMLSVAMLAIGVGASTAFFSVLNNVLWRRPPGLASTEGLFVLIRTDGENEEAFLHRQYLEYRARLNSFSELIGYRGASVVLRDGGAPIHIDAALVTENFFRGLGLAIRPGRDFRPEENQVPGAHPVAIISHRLWQGRFQGDPGIVGRTLTFRETAYTVIGVAPPDFGTLELGWGEVTDVWLPLMMEGRLAVMFPTVNNDLFHSLKVIGRLRPGTSRAQAEAELGVVSASIEKADTKTGRRKHVVLSRHLWNWRQSDRSNAYGIVGLLSALAALVLVVGCANVANLQLARAAARRREMAIRVSLGATRARLLRQMVAESLLLAVASGGAGLWLGWAMARWFWRLIGFAVETRVDATVAAFAFALALLAAFASAIVPAWRGAPRDVMADLKAGAAQVTRVRTRLQTVLLIGQVAASLVLLYGAGLFLRTVLQLRAVDYGFDGTNLLLVAPQFDLAEYPDERIRRVRREFAERLAEQPGIVAVAQAVQLPRGANFFWNNRQVLPGPSEAGPAGPAILAEYNEIGPGYFAALGLPLRRGRDFDRRDRPGAPLVAIVNETLAARLWPGGDPIGELFRVRRPFDTPVYQVIGVAPDLRVFTREERPPPQFYLALDQGRETDGRTLVRAEAGALLAAAATARRILQEVDPGLPPPETEDFATYLANGRAIERMYAVMGSALGSVALAVSAFGLAALLAYDVAHRIREIGIRMALGAERRQVILLVVGEGMAIVAIGAVVGAALAAGGTRFVAGRLYGISPFDGLSAGVSALLVIAVSLLACWVPARRAARVDPLVALRCE